MDERIKRIAVNYGLFHQLRKTQEELRELYEAIGSFLNGEQGTLDHVIEECVDVEIMLEQIRLLLGRDSDDAFKAYRDYKLIRQIRRIENGE